MTGQAKIDNVELQMKAVQREGTNVIQCPYCGAQNFEGNVLCCQKMARTVAAIMVRWDLKARTEHVERVLEKANAN